MTVTLADFLLARIGEDEAVARAAGGPPWEMMTWPKGYTVLVAARAIRDDKLRLGHLGHVASVEHAWDVEHIARHDPARVLAECEAKRRIVEVFAPHVGGPTDRHDFGQYAGRQTLGALAGIYADHPDFDEAWRL